MSGEGDKKPAPFEMYDAPNDLAKRVAKKTAPSLAQMEKEAADQLASLNARYKASLDKTIYEIAEALEAVSLSKDTLQFIFSKTHDLTGNAPVFGYPTISKVADIMCDLVRGLPDEMLDKRELLQLHAKALRWTFENENNPEAEVAKEQLVATLKQAARA
jgi:chemotaxis protein histidine kinase CheA